ncbi:MAG: GTP-binding protein [Aequorivita sp.]|nr:GTP-binding protein [Aequorivita sp.]|tara:strand:- start:43847 stop:44335 length:489 start_codon:yes stop_codon:yes gene_type:complete
MLSNDIVLRPRFKLETKDTPQQLLEKFKAAKLDESEYTISCVDDHVFIKLPNRKEHFWSPQLHLEIFKTEDNTARIHGFFGPNPTVWTMFIFLHVAVGILFMVNAIWLYSNYNLNNSIALQITIAIALIISWIFLYIAGSIGKKKGKPGMRELYDYMLKIIG